VQASRGSRINITDKLAEEGGDSMAAVESLTVKAAFSFVTNGVIAPKHP
jgi:hypothetical protein